MSALDAARAYLDRGWMPLPIPHRAKAPTIKDWGQLEITRDNVEQHFNGRAQNIGVVLGPRSGGVVDVDLDCDEAVRLAGHLLPQTSAIFGRKSKPNSHFLYTVRDAEPKAAIRFIDANRSVLLEL